MSNRRYQQFSWSNATMPVTVYAQVTFGATGAPTLNKGSNDISSVVRNSAGDYTFTFRSTFAQLLGINYTFNSGASAPTGPFMAVKSNLIATAASKSIEIVFRDADTPAATDPASGEILYISFTFNNSSLSN
jgi:hypothetical protein